MSWSHRDSTASALEWLDPAPAMPRVSETGWAGSIADA